MALDALTTATAGLKVTQAAIGVVAQNVANAGTAGYVRRTLTPVADGPGNSGVASGTISRTFDAAALRQLRLETSGAAYTGLTAEIRARLDALYGEPGSANALDGALNGFGQALQGLAADPASSAVRAAVIDRASNLAARIGTVAEGVQALRSGLEAGLASDTARASGLLDQIAALNTRVASAGNGEQVDLLDQRDQAVTALSALMDVRTVAQRDGTVTVLTGSGVTLVERGIAAGLSFDGRGTLAPGAAYAPGASGVGTVRATTPGGAVIDLIAARAIGSGSLAAAIELRDAVLPQAQRQLDELAGGLSRAMSDRLAAGTPAVADGRSGFDIDLAGLRPGNAITVAVQDAGGSRNIILVPRSGAASAIDPRETTDASARVVNLDVSGGAAGLGAAFAAALAPYGLAAGPVPGGAAGTVRILGAVGGGPQVAAVSASVTAAGDDPRNGAPQLALFVDGGRGGSLFTGSFEGGSQLTGFAQRIRVNPAVAGATSTLVATGPATLPGDATRPQFLTDALTRGVRTFSSASGIGGVSAPYDASVPAFAQAIVAAQGAGAASARDLDEGQGIALATAQGRFAAGAGVNIDEEMSRLIELQNAYSANARVLSAARDMLDTLLRI